MVKSFSEGSKTCGKRREFADDNFKYDENGEKFFKRVENLWKKEKLLIMSNFSFSHSVFKRLVQQKSKNKGLFEKRVNSSQTIRFVFHKAGGIVGKGENAGQ